MREKVYGVASDDLGNVSFSLEKTLAAVQSTHSYLSDMIREPSEQTNTALCMLSVIEDLTRVADDQLSTAINTLCKISQETEETA
ncbi:MAG: hypothetical protein K2G87_10675 [Oscillospiraceae bacterium]|nr:hypothetical protein [Oscillospiraceae bacterium]